MKRWSVFVAVVGASGLAAAVGAQVAQPRPAATMQQVMQAVIFPNANLFFSAQLEDPAAVVRDQRASASTNPLTGLYGGWQAVENSGLVLADTAELLNVPGRVCSNGRPVPVQDAEWKAAVEALRKAGIAAAGAARTRRQDTVFEVAQQVTDSCSNCHRRYRVQANRCVAP